MSLKVDFPYDGRMLIPQRYITQLPSEVPALAEGCVEEVLTRLLVD